MLEGVFSPSPEWQMETWWWTYILMDCAQFYVDRERRPLASVTWVCIELGDSETHNQRWSIFFFQKVWLGFSIVSLFQCTPTCCGLASPPHLSSQVMPVVTTDAHVPPPNLEQVFVPTKGR